MRSPAKLVRILALICIAALLLAAIATVPGLNFAVLVALVFVPVVLGVSRERVLEGEFAVQLLSHFSLSRPRSPPVSR